MSMKMTARDKRLLSFVSVAGIFLLFVFLVLLPLHRANQEMKQQLAENEASVWERELKISQLPAMQAAYEEKQAELAGIVEPLYPMLRSRDIDRILQQEVMTNGLAVTKLQITMPKEPADVVAYGQDAKEKGGNPDKSEDGLYLANVTLEVSGQLSDIYRLIDTFANDVPGVRITSLRWNGNRKSGNTADGAADQNILELQLWVAMSIHK